MSAPGWSRDDGPPGGRGVRRRSVCQPWHRHAHPDSQPHLTASMSSCTGERHPASGPYPRRGGRGCRFDQRGQETVTTLPGAAFFSLATCSNHPRRPPLVSQCLARWCFRSLRPANWMIPARWSCHVGGAMVHGACKVIVMMEHTAKDGSPRS